MSLWHIKTERLVKLIQKFHVILQMKINPEYND